MKINTCDRAHITYPETNLINYAKSLNRKIKRGASVDDIGAALKRLRQAADQLEAAEAREKDRAR